MIEGPVHAAARRPDPARRAGRHARAGRLVRLPAFDHAHPAHVEPRPPARARPRHRPRGARRALPGEPRRRRRAASCRRRSRATRPTSRSRFDPDLARRTSRVPGVGPVRLAVLDGGPADDRRRARGVARGPRRRGEIRDAGRSTEEATDAPAVRRRADRLTGWLPGYADPEYFLRLLFQSDSRTNEGGFAIAPFDELIERARQERSDRGPAGAVPPGRPDGGGRAGGLIPLVYGAEHGLREAVGAGLVGVRQVLVVVRRPGRWTRPRPGDATPIR